MLFADIKVLAQGFSQLLQLRFILFTRHCWEVIDKRDGLFMRICERFYPLHDGCGYFVGLLFCLHFQFMQNFFKRQGVVEPSFVDKLSFERFRELLKLCKVCAEIDKFAYSKDKVYRKNGCKPDSDVCNKRLLYPCD